MELADVAQWHVRDLLRGDALQHAVGLRHPVVPLIILETVGCSLLTVIFEPGSAATTPSCSLPLTVPPRSATVAPLLASRPSCPFLRITQSTSSEEATST